MNKNLLSSTFLIIIIGSLALTATTRFSMVKAAANVTGMITSDTTWTKADSPYDLTGPVSIVAGVTVTIEPGATVNLYDYYIQVNGVLKATGTNADRITITGSTVNALLDPSPHGIIFTESSPGWNEQTGTGSIVENSIFNGVTITVSNSAKINNNTIIGSIDVAGGSPYILNNSIYGSHAAINICGGSPQIKYNYLVGGINGNSSARFPIISNNYVIGGISIQSGSPVISGNVITSITSLSREWYLANNDTVQLSAGSNNDYLSIGIGLTGCNVGDDKLYGAVVTDNSIVGCLMGICWNAGGGAVIARNLIANCSREGLSICSNALVENNTIRNCSVGIHLCNFNGIDDALGDSYFPPTILNNNIENSSQYNIHSYCGSDLDVTYNWWGTTDAKAINEKMYRNDFNVGYITFVPFLTEPNPQAMPDPNMITQLPTPNPTPNSTPTPSPSPIPVPSQSFFFVESNSTITELFFNSTSQELSFTVNGTSRTTGYVKVTIAKSLVSSVQSVKVYLDGNQLNVAITENEDSWLLSFTYTHSKHQVTVSLATDSDALLAGAESWVWIVSTIVIGMLLAVAVSFMCRRKGLSERSARSAKPKVTGQC